MSWLIEEMSFALPAWLADGSIVFPRFAVGTAYGSMLCFAAAYALAAYRRRGSRS